MLFRSAQWDQDAWDKWVAAYGVLEPLVLKTAFGDRHAVGRNSKGELVYRLNTDGEV